MEGESASADAGLACLLRMERVEERPSVVRDPDERERFDSFVTWRQTVGRRRRMGHVKALADEMLLCVADSFALEDLRFDEEGNCIVNADGIRVMICRDIEADRLYVCATLLAHLPRSPQERLQLYEFLLEGSLAVEGDMFGGVGISRSQDCAVQATFLPLSHSDRSALRFLIPPFVRSVVAWRQRLRVHFPSLFGAPVRSDLNLASGVPMPARTASTPGVPRPSALT